MYVVNGLGAAPGGGSGTATTVKKPTTSSLKWYANIVSLTTRPLVSKALLASPEQWLGPFLSNSQALHALAPYKAIVAAQPKEWFVVNNQTGEMQTFVAVSSRNLPIPASWTSRNIYDKRVDAQKQADAVKWSIDQGRIDLPGTLYYVNRKDGGMWRVVPPKTFAQVVPSGTSLADYASFSNKTAAIEFQKKTYMEISIAARPVRVGGYWVFRKGGIWYMSQGFKDAAPTGVDPGARFFLLNEQGAAIAYLNQKKVEVGTWERPGVPPSKPPSKPPIIVVRPPTKPPGPALPPFVPVLPPLDMPRVPVLPPLVKPPVPVLPPGADVVTVKADQPVNVITDTGNVRTVDAATVAESTPVETMPAAETSTPIWLWFALAGAAAFFFIGGKGKTRGKAKRRSR